MTDTIGDIDPRARSG